MTRRVYLDWNATAPLLGEAAEAMMEAARAAWANPASVHAEGRAARGRVEEARARVGELLGGDARDVVLTSGGTEANNLALRSAFDGGSGRTVLVTSPMEHPSVARVAEALAREGKAALRLLRVLPEGTVDLEDLRDALAGGGVRLVAVQAVNHETGVLQDVDTIVRMAHDAGAEVHVDAVQAAGKIPVRGALADTRSIAAHKLGGPKGIGALVTRAGARVAPVLLGGSQERGVRPGTVDPIAAAGFAIAAREGIVAPRRYEQVAALRDRLEQGILERARRAVVNGSAPRAPHVTNVTFPGWLGPELVAALDLEGVAVSSGSACSAGTAEPSPTLCAMFDEGRARASVRFSLGATTTDHDVNAALAALGRVLARSP